MAFGLLVILVDYVFLYYVFGFGIVLINRLR